MSAACLVFFAVFRRSQLSPHPSWSFLVSVYFLRRPPSVAAVRSSPFVLVPPRFVDLSVSDLCSVFKRVLPRAEVNRAHLCPSSSLSGSNLCNLGVCWCGGVVLWNSSRL